MGTAASVDVADAERSSSQSRSVSLHRTWAQPILSRAGAAQLTVGANDELEDDDLAYCSTPPLSAQAQRALELLRIAAPPALGVYDSELSTDDLLHNLDPSPATGSVGDRLGVILDDPALEATGNVPAYFDLTMEDFELARAYLMEEGRAYARVGGVALPGRTAGSYMRFPAIENEPRPLPDAYYASLVRAPRPAWSNAFEDIVDADRMDGVDVMPDLADLVEVSRNELSQILKLVELSMLPDDEARTNTLEPIQAALTKVSQQRVGRLEARMDPINSCSYLSAVYGASEDEGTG